MVQVIRAVNVETHADWKSAIQQTGSLRYVRLKAHLNSRVRVPDLADTVEPVTESNCARAITLGGEQLKVNNQSVTNFSVFEETVNSIRSVVSDEPA